MGCFPCFLASGTRKKTSGLKESGDALVAGKTFKFHELSAPINNPRPECIIGERVFGRVYKGRLPNGQVVAVKQLDVHEFMTEVEILNFLRHPNLINLIGYCNYGDQTILLYEFMPFGSLEDHLHDLPLDKEPLDWSTRMKIVYGVAKGMEYLHDKANLPIIYRNFKSSNILLGEGYFSKLSNFGLAILGPTGESHIATKVKGTYGYVAPEYALTGQATVKSDVYSFGVVFLELITGRKAIDSTRPQGQQNLVAWVKQVILLYHAIDSTRPQGQQNLVAWARPLFNDHRRFAKLVDPRLRGKFPMRGFYQALAVASVCIQEQADARPPIGEVVTAVSYLANDQAYNPNSAPGHSNRIAADNDEQGEEILKNEEGGGSWRKWDLEGSERDDSP